jgi:hypothetical protein
MLGGKVMKFLNKVFKSLFMLVSILNLASQTYATEERPVKRQKISKHTESNLYEENNDLPIISSITLEALPLETLHQHINKYLSLQDIVNLKKLSKGVNLRFIELENSISLSFWRDLYLWNKSHGVLSFKKDINSWKNLYKFTHSLQKHFRILKPCGKFSQEEFFLNLGSFIQPESGFFLYLQGIISEIHKEDKAQALKFYDASYKKGYIPSSDKLVTILNSLEDIGLPEAQRFEELKRLEEQGNSKAHEYMIWTLIEGDLGPTRDMSPDECFKEILEREKKGSSFAGERIIDILSHPNQLEISMSEKERYYELLKREQQGSQKAKKELNHILAEGQLGTHKAYSNAERFDLLLKREIEGDNLASHLINQILFGWIQGWDGSDFEPLQTEDQRYAELEKRESNGDKDAAYYVSKALDDHWLNNILSPEERYTKLVERAKAGEKASGDWYVRILFLGDHWFIEGMTQEQRIIELLELEASGNELAKKYLAKIYQEGTLGTKLKMSKEQRFEELLKRDAYDEIKGFKYASLALIDESLEERLAENNNTNKRPEKMEEYRIKLLKLATSGDLSAQKEICKLSTWPIFYKEDFLEGFWKYTDNKEYKENYEKLLQLNFIILNTFLEIKNEE